MEPIILTDAALLHLKKTIVKRGSGIGLRLSIKTTGCSGFSYVVDVVDEADPADQVYPQADGALVFIDAKSHPFIQGLQVDYIRNGLNEGFKFSNPNAMGICGCGESFSVAADNKDKRIG